MKSKELAGRIKLEILDGFPKPIDVIQSRFGIWHVAAFNGYFNILLAKEDRNEVNLYRSLDGEKFKYYENNPVIKTGSPGEFDDIRIEPHGLVYSNERWLLYYGGYSWNFERPIIRHLSKRGRWRVGLAESQNLIKWKKYELNPIFSKKSHVADPRTTIFKNQYFLYYLTSKPGCHVAYSSDSLRWQDHSQNPILEKIVASFLVKEGVLIGFCIWDNGIGIALSDDGINWTYAEKNPIIKPNMMPPWDILRVGWPFAIDVENTIYLYYTIVDESKIWRMAIAKIRISF